MRFVLHHLLNILGSPMMESLTPGTTLAARKIKVFHDDNIDLELVCDLNDEVCRFDGNVLVDTIRSRPKPRHACCAVALSFLDVLQSTFQRVLLFRQFQKTPADDSAL